ncbi:alpha/beta fold hydrolase [Gymnodinialimonas hymeniacidonis]|uniref:alpha/beta fold hydrolase n=1 Tax=Gymnodinialimonas hymeniacidonis TaxID=3126508 RepID=UPI0034C6C4F7
MHWPLPDRIQTSAGRIAATRIGSGPPLVLAHGWPWSSYSWSRVVPRLSQRFTCHLYDMPGFGQSDKTGPRPMSLDTQGEVFAEMLDHWGLSEPAVIAHDFGGAVTLRAHILHGCRYSAWVLMNVVAMRPWGSGFFDHVGRHTDAFHGTPPHIHEAIVRAYINGALIRDLPSEDIEALVTPWLGAQGQSAFYAQFALADERFTAEVEPSFPALTPKPAILWGAEDPWIPLDRGRALAELIGAPLTELVGLGHLPQLEDPDRVASALLSDLKAH